MKHMTFKSLRFPLWQRLLAVPARGLAALRSMAAVCAGGRTMAGTARQRCMFGELLLTLCQADARL